MPALIIIIVILALIGVGLFVVFRGAKRGVKKGIEKVNRDDTRPRS